MAIPFLDSFTAIKSFITSFSGSQTPTDGDQVDPVGDEDDQDDWCAPHWDCFIDSANRAMRPAMLVGVFVMFACAWFWPAHFILFAGALKALPDFIWYVILTIVGGWMASRFRSHKRAPQVAPVPVPVLVDTTTVNVSAPSVSTPTPVPTGIAAQVSVPVVQLPIGTTTIIANTPDPDYNPSLAAWKKHENK